ncbi:hypothetical protein GA0070606_0147 [Micromonospora citrea]|uniref:Uncharacterized protein n=1 Tax=Micromonospora citrea TaxID=47855 RepID=A0A1C6TR63_9ACTN|nr:hypothetical protein [Micromonospora citrea]SCL44121.1 hypothetical protein GA0070606_0147 [Micromonospora citrea]
MSFRICAPPTGFAVAPTPPPALTRRRHVDMMRVCSASCRPGDPR